MGPGSIESVPAVALYPGCTLEASSTPYRDSLLLVADALDLPLSTLRDWSCCGASSAHAVDPALGLDLALRNLALAERQGYSEILAPCAACYHRLASAELKFRREADVLADCASRSGLSYQGRVRVRNLLDLLANIVGVDRVRARVRRPLAGLRVACYYGCLNTRIRGLEPFDDREWPVSMDRVVEALGAVSVEWGSRTECCGASLFVTREEVSSRLVAAILRDAVIHEADCIAVSCPMCQNNLDVRQPEYRERFDIPRAVPVLFLTQLAGLAFGVDSAALGLSHQVVPLQLEDKLEAAVAGHEP
jgi:heterodisulfide reductase subunit B